MNRGDAYVKECEQCHREYERSRPTLRNRDRVPERIIGRCGWCRAKARAEDSSDRARATRRATIERDQQRRSERAHHFQLAVANLERARVELIAALGGAGVLDSRIERLIARIRQRDDFRSEETP